MNREPRGMVLASANICIYRHWLFVTQCSNGCRRCARRDFERQDLSSRQILSLNSSSFGLVGRFYRGYRFGRGMQVDFDDHGVTFHVRQADVVIVVIYLVHDHHTSTPARRAKGGSVLSFVNEQHYICMCRAPVSSGQHK